VQRILTARLTAGTGRSAKRALPPHTHAARQVGLPVVFSPTSILTCVKDPARPFRQASVRLTLAVLGGLLPGSVPVIVADSLSVM
jgi:hypothetical protein